MSLDQLVVWEEPDGKVSVHTPALPVTVITNADLPTDREFRDAWRLKNGKIVIDLAVAKEIHKDRIRTAREGAFPGLDSQFNQALEADDKEKMKAVGEVRQQLRDATNLDDVKTLKQLKAHWPALLGERPVWEQK